MDKIILLDEENNEVEFELIDTFGVDEANYAPKASKWWIDSNLWNYRRR